MAALGGMLGVGKSYKESAAKELLDKIFKTLSEKHFIPRNFKRTQKEDRALLRDQFLLLFLQADSLLQIIQSFDKIINRKSNEELGQFGKQIRTGWKKITNDIIEAGYYAKEDALDRFNSPKNNPDIQYIMSTLSTIANNCDINDARQLLINLEFDIEKFDPFKKLIEKGFEKEDELIMKLLIKSIPLLAQHQGLILEELQNYFHLSLGAQCALERNKGEISGFSNVIKLISQMMQIKDLHLKEQLFELFVQTIAQDLNSEHYKDCTIGNNEAADLASLGYEEVFSKENVALFKRAMNSILPKEYMTKVFLPIKRNDSNQSSDSLVSTVSTVSLNSKPK